MRFVLISNLDYVSIGPVRCYAHALLLEEVPSIFDKSKADRRLRAFGTCAEWPVMDMKVPSIDCQIQSMDGNIINVSTCKTINGAANLHIKDGPCLHLTCTVSGRHDLVIDTLEGNDASYDKLWPLLKKRVAENWAAPAMPSLVWGRPRP
jgi:hypothetical protein